MQPGKFQPPNSRDEGWIGRELQTLRREMNELRAANVFGLTGVRPKNGGTEFEGYLNVNGELNINGPAKITGTLDLPTGIIGNDSLTSPSTGRSDGATARGFTVPAATPAVIASFGFTVPDGYTKAAVIALGSAFVYNPGAATDYVYAAIHVDVSDGRTSNGQTLISLIGGSGGSVNLTPNNMQSIEGLSGGDTITCSIRMYTGTNAINHASNSATVHGMATFTR